MCLVASAVKSMFALERFPFSHNFNGSLKKSDVPLKLSFVETLPLALKFGYSPLIASHRLTWPESPQLQMWNCCCAA